jgi:hypothetical protein
VNPQVDTALTRLDLWLTLFVAVLLPMVIGFWVGVFWDDSHHNGGIPMPPAAVTVVLVCAGIGLMWLLNNGLQHVNLAAFGSLYCGGK